MSDNPHVASTQKAASLACARSFAGRSVFVTGHTGFKGSWLCLWLKRWNARVTGYALAPPTQPNHFEIAGIQERLDRHYLGDIRDEGKLQAALQQAQPDVILHLAAQSVVRHGYQFPRETFDVNVMGTASLLESVRKLDRPCVIVAVTSDKCYENREQCWGYRECDPMGEHDPYGASKGAAELVIRAYRDSFFPVDRIEQHGVKLASARAGNVVGGGDFTSDALVVDTVSALARNIPVELRNPQAYRPWQHVLQALSGYLTLAAKLLDSNDPAFCGGWNFGPYPGNEVAVQQVVELLISEWGTGRWIDAWRPDQPRESRILRLAIDKALWQLGWKPHWNIESTLHHTAHWYRAYFDGHKNMGDVGIRQIEEFEKGWMPNNSSPCPAPWITVDASETASTARV